MSTDAAVARYGSEAPSLVIISGNDRGRRIPVPSTGIVLGREGKLASLFRDDPLVSRGHAHFYLAEDRSVQVADLNSTNGTFVNGKAIRSLTRLADRDVLRIGSIDMRLDSPRADNQPADETVKLPAARASWPDPFAGRRAPPERPWYEDGRQDFPSAAGWPDAQAEAHDGLREPPQASAAASTPPDARAPAPADTTEPVSFAPHPLRLLAFMIDLFLVAAVTRAVAVVTGSLAGVCRRAAHGLGHLPDRVGVADRRPHDRQGGMQPVRPPHRRLRPAPGPGRARLGVRPGQPRLPGHRHGRPRRPGGSSQPPATLPARLRLRQRGGPAPLHQ